MTKRQAHALERAAQSARLGRVAARERDRDIRVAVRLGLSLRQVAEATGVSHTTVARIANGGRNAGAK